MHGRSGQQEWWRELPVLSRRLLRSPQKGERLMAFSSLADSSAVQVRMCRAEEREAANAFHNAAFGDDRTMTEWMWEFANGPYGPAIFGVAELDGAILGTHALLPVSLMWRGREFAAAKNEETLVAQELRGTGVGRRLFQFCFEEARTRGLTAAWGFTTARLRPWIRAGYSVPGKARYGLLVLDAKATSGLVRGWSGKTRGVTRVGRAFAARAGAFAGAGYAVAASRWGRLRSVAGITLQEVRSADERFDQLWSRYSGTLQSCTIVRSAEYLAWRLFDNPNVDVLVLMAEHGKEPVGYVALSFSRKDRSAQITDLCVVPEFYDEVAGLLLAESIDVARARGVACLFSWVGSFRNAEVRRYSLCLARHGFAFLPMGIPMQLATLAGDGAEKVLPGSMEDWFITLLFSQGRD